MAKTRRHNPKDKRHSGWHTKVWDSIEGHGNGVAERYEATADRDGNLDINKLDDHDRTVVKEAERRANEY